MLGEKAEASGGSEARNGTITENDTRPNV